MLFCICYKEERRPCLRRNAIQALVNRKDSEERKPTVLKGARQVGKTWLMNVLELYAQSSPGDTCVGVLEGDDTVNCSKGCGVMRVAPIGPYFGEGHPLAVDMLAREIYFCDLWKAMIVTMGVRSAYANPCDERPAPE